MKVILLLGVFAAASANVFAPEKDHDLEYWKEEGWQKVDKTADGKPIELVFALKQQNVADLEHFVQLVSDPDSGLYGKYITVDDLTKLIQPTKKTVDIVHVWLRQNNVNKCELTKNRDFLSCKTTVASAEKALPGASFYNFKHEKFSKNVVRSITRYYIPSYLAEHIDFVGGLHRFPAVNYLKTKMEKVEMNNNMHLRDESKVHIGVYPKVLRERYNLTNSDVGSHPNNSQVVTQFLEQYFHQADLSEFMKLFVGNDFVHRTKIDKIIGPNTGRSGIEASLDTQYIMGLGANISTWFWSTPGRHDNEEPFLTWLRDVSNMTKVPWVHSVSYGEDELKLSKTYMKRVNVEFMKTAARGLTILFASGDDGAGCKKNKFSPDFPVSSPYVTGVGGTGFNNPFGTGKEFAYEISGGGFSNLFARPKYQAEPVEEYLNTDTVPPREYFNETGRAYPDIAALSRHFWIVNNRIPAPGVAGTSAATPTVAGIISMLNEHRLKADKPVMGFLNPFLYKNPQAMFDVMSGCNEGCLSHDKGFCAQKGYDPVTGNGTPNYPELVKAAMKAVGY